MENKVPLGGFFSGLWRILIFTTQFLLRDYYHQTIYEDPVINQLG